VIPLCLIPVFAILWFVERRRSYANK
jgi:hypothetical protein